MIGMDYVISKNSFTSNILKQPYFRIIKLQSNQKDEISKGKFWHT